MVVENFRGGDPVPVYRRFRERGRLAPVGLRYIDSWVAADFSRCYQLMECEDRRLFEHWISHWEDIVQFEIVPVVTSPEAVEVITAKL
ncbi:MAG: DUF3303 domain-containing protein [Acidobacteriia bacterium]|nr:DUF3303 domain-containing protein [Terriglobia bacterium]